MAAGFLLEQQDLFEQTEGAFRRSHRIIATNQWDLFTLEQSCQLLRRRVEAPASTRRLITGKQIGAWLGDIAQAMVTNDIDRTGAILTSNREAVGLKLERMIDGHGPHRFNVLIFDTRSQPRTVLVSIEQLRNLTLWPQQRDPSEQQPILASATHVTLDTSQPLRYVEPAPSVKDSCRVAAFAIAHNMPDTVNALMDRLHAGDLSTGDRDMMANAIREGMAEGLRHGLDVEAGAKALLRLQLPESELLNIAGGLTQTMHEAMLNDQPKSIQSHGRMLIALGIKQHDSLVILSAKSSQYLRTPIQLALNNMDGTRSSPNAIRAYGSVLKLHGVSQQQVVSLLEPRDSDGQPVLHVWIQRLTSYLKRPDVSTPLAIEAIHRFASIVKAYTDVLQDHGVPLQQILDVIGTKLQQELHRDIAAGQPDLAQAWLDKLKEASPQLTSESPMARQVMQDTVLANSISPPLALALQSLRRRWPHVMPLDTGDGPDACVDLPNQPGRPEQDQSMS